MDATGQACPTTTFAQRTHLAMRIVALAALAVLLLTLTTVALTPDDDTFDADEFSGMASLALLWLERPIHLFLFVVILKGVSVFNLIVRYKGGHSGRQYFNDRTIENNKLSLLCYLFNDDSIGSRHFCFPEFLTQGRK
jgi:hypothetical protein